LRKKGLATGGNKPELTDRVESALRKQQDDLLQDAKQKKPKVVEAFEFERVSEFVVGTKVIFVSKEMDGNIDTSDEYAMFVVTVTKVSFTDPGEKGKDEEMREEERVIEFSILDNGKSRLEEAPVDRFFQLPAGPLETVYPERHLVLFQRSISVKKDVFDSLLEVGWLWSSFKTSSSKLVELDSFDGVDDVPKENILFDVFESKKHNNDVEFKATLFEIEFSDNRTSAPNK
jgi:hypothetical protein